MRRKRFTEERSRGEEMELEDAPVELLVANLPSSLAHQVIGQSGRYHGVRLIVVDSIQGHGF